LGAIADFWEGETLCGDDPTPDGPVRGWGLRHAWPVVGAGVGALLAGAYGGSIAVIHFAVWGHWDRGPGFAGGVTVAGAVLGLVVGTLSALVGRRSVPSKAQTELSSGPARSGGPDATGRQSAISRSAHLATGDCGVMKGPEEGQVQGRVNVSLRDL
jgi:hypothetical protein